MKQTAVQWLYNHLFPKQLDGFSDEEWSKIDLAFEKAKQMEKQQIIDAYNIATKTKYNIAMHKLGISTQPPLVENAEQYYNETFKNS